MSTPKHRTIVFPHLLARRRFARRRATMRLWPRKREDTVDMTVGAYGVRLLRLKVGGGLFPPFSFLFLTRRSRNLASIRGPYVNQIYQGDSPLSTFFLAGLGFIRKWQMETSHQTHNPMPLRLEGQY